MRMRSMPFAGGAAGKFGAYKKALGLTEGPCSPNYKRREELTVDRPYSHHATTSS